MPPAKAERSQGPGPDSRSGANMQLAQLEAFIEVARQGNVGRAASRIYVSQPALTARIRSLEAELGVELFHRTSRGMRLTSAGLTFLPYADRSLRAVRDGSKLVAGVREGYGGELMIGAAPAVSTYVLPEVLARFAEQRPKVRVNVRTGHTDQIIEMVAWGEVDVGMTRETDDTRVMTSVLYEDELVLVARPDHPLSQGSRSGAVEFSDTRFILFDRASSYYAMTSALLREAGVIETTVMELDNIAAAKRMVERGLGVSLLPATAVADALASGSLLRIPWPPAESLRRPIVLVRRRDRGRQPPAEAALCELLTHIPDLIPGARVPS